MHITFENIIEKVVNNRSLSRKDKQIAITLFLKDKTGKTKNLGPEEITIIETLKNAKKGYLQKDKSEK